MREEVACRKERSARRRGAASSGSSSSPGSSWGCCYRRGHSLRAVAAAHGDIVARGNGYFSVPAYYSPGHGPCFAFNPGVTPECHTAAAYPDRIGSSRATAFVNSPVYYLAVGWPSLVLSGDAAVYSMRIVSALATSALLALAFALLHHRRSPWAMVGLAAGMTPTLLFLGGTVNPNAIEAAGAAALYVSLDTFARRRPAGRVLAATAIGVVAGTLAVASGRMFGLIWVPLILIAVMIPLRGPDWVALVRSRLTWVVLGACAVILGGTLLWFQRPVLEGDPNPENVQSLVSVALTMLESTFDYWAGMIGLFGWLDTPAPEVVIALWTSLFLAGLVAGIALSSGRDRLVAVFLAAALVLVPVAMQVGLYPRLGFMWQGRYVLAALLCALIAAGLALDGRTVRPGPPLAADPVRIMLRAVILLVAIGQLVAFVAALRRYVVGSGSIVDLVLNPVWHPPLTAIGSLVLFGAALLLATAVAWRSVGAWRSATADIGSPVRQALVDFPRP
jgi:hypothetical protein